MMKTILIMSLVFINTLAFCQLVDVPEVVLEAFENKYPDIEDVTWKKLKTNYQATFEDLELTMVQFTPEGKWVKTATIITEGDLPVFAEEYISENIEDAVIMDVQMIENNKEEIIYQVVLMSGAEKIKLKFDAEGNLIE